MFLLFVVQFVLFVFIFYVVMSGKKKTEKLKTEIKKLNISAKNSIKELDNLKSKINLKG